jgi:hypothetical protein
MFYSCDNLISILIIYATIVLKGCMLIHILFMMQQTDHIVSLSGYVPIAYNVDIEHILLFLHREYVIFLLRFSSYSD